MDANGTATTANGMVGNTIAPAVKKWFHSRGISEKTVQAFGITTEGAGSNLTIVFPFVEAGKVVNRKYRGKDKAFRQDKDARKTFYNWGALADAAAEQNPDMPVVIVEGEMDALSVHEAGYPFVVSIPDGAPQKETQGEVNPHDDAKFQCVWNNEEIIAEIQSFVLAGDGDEPGRVLNAELQRRLGVERCYSIEFPDDCKDFNDVLVKHGREKVLEIIKARKPYPVKGLYTLDEYPEMPLPQLFSSGIADMDSNLMLERGRFMVVTGVPSHGKSEFIERIFFNLAKNYGWHCALSVFEDEVKPGIRDNMLHRYHRKPVNQQSQNDRRSGSDWIKDHFSFIAQHPGLDEDTELTLEDIIDLTEISVMRYGTKALLIDPWNEIEHKRRRDEREDEYIGRAIRLLKRLARRFDILVVVVAHPTKMSDRGSVRKPTLYDISGGGMWYNKADYGVIVWRDDASKPLTEIRLSKIKKQRYMGKPGVLEYEFDTYTADYFPHVSDKDLLSAA